MLKKFTIALAIFVCCTTFVLAQKSYSRGSSSSGGKSYSSGSSSSSRSYSSPSRPTSSSSSTHSSTSRSYSSPSKPSASSYSSTRTTTTHSPKPVASSHHTTVNHNYNRSYGAPAPSYFPVFIPWGSNTVTVVRDHPTIVGATEVHTVERVFSWRRTFGLILLISVISFAVYYVSTRK